MPEATARRFQSLTMEDLLSGKEKPQYFDMSSGTHSFKKAKVEEERATQKPLL